MAVCVVCEGSGRFLCEVCPLCDGVPGWPHSLDASQQIGVLDRPTSRLQMVVEQMQRRLPMSNPEKQLSVVSFNMLLKGFDEKFYYPSVRADLRAWPRRRELLLQMIRGVDADVYCMQEVECLSFSKESVFLAELGYAWVEPRDDSKGKYPDMAKPAFFYKADRLELLWTNHRSRVVLACFRHRSSNHIIYMATCHLEGAPWEAEKRVAQTKKALESVQRQMVADKKASGIGIGESSLIFAGDFNEDAEGVVCHLLRTGFLAKSFRAPGLPDVELTKVDYSHSFGLSDLYGSMRARPHTFCAPPEESAAWGSQVNFACVDFVFYSHASLRPVAVREPFTPEQMQETADIGIPSDWHFSDHVPVGGVFEFVGNGDPSPIAFSLV